MPRTRKVFSPKAALEGALASRIVLQGSKRRDPEIAFEQLQRAKGVLALHRAKKPGQMHEDTWHKLQIFVSGWLNKRVDLEVTLHEQAKAIAKRRDLTKTNAYQEALGKRRRGIVKRLSEKAALEQVFWVIAHQRMLQSRGKKIDPVEPTAVVKRFGRLFFNPKDLPGSFVRMVKAVSEIPIIECPRIIAEAYYGLPTAEETIMANGILGVYKRFGRGRREPAWGCGTQCDVINAVLNAWEWENYHVRTRNNLGYPHSVALAGIPKTKMWLVGDPFKGHNLVGPFEKFQSSQAVAQVGQVLGQHIQKLKKQRAWKEGRSLSDYVKNFEGYNRERT